MSLCLIFALYPLSEPFLLTSTLSCHIFLNSVINSVIFNRPRLRGRHWFVPTCCLRPLRNMLDVLMKKTTGGERCLFVWLAYQSEPACMADKHVFMSSSGSSFREIWLIVVKKRLQFFFFSLFLSALYFHFRLGEDFHLIFRPNQKSKFCPLPPHVLKHALCHLSSNNLFFSHFPSECKSHLRMNMMSCDFE